MLDQTHDGQPSVAPSWTDQMKLPPRAIRTWITFSEMAELLRQEGLAITRELARQAVWKCPPKHFRAWNCYEANHVELVRRAARKQQEAAS